MNCEIEYRFLSSSNFNSKRIEFVMINRRPLNSLFITFLNFPHQLIDKKAVHRIPFLYNLTNPEVSIVHQQFIIYPFGYSISDGDGDDEN